MNHANLTARYRPQTFADLAGQETVRAILSRAAAEDRVAPAYLFSGTRGVGKTTVARIFAKALNCEHSPAAEPCNTCDRCRQITAGTAVDVVEIDGASNRGIDDVRKLKEIVGYAPMEGRYRVFIIDEAHMLSRDAFNALLKTLEEPPARVTFILATTESHKFPATILSRCQHYVFKRLSEQGIEEHLGKVLTKEGVSFDEAALRLIARRAAGSVRDSMSLLGQVLALGGERLTEDDTRTVLGLAGQELLFTLFTLLREGDTAGIARLVRGMLDSGVDLGFFLREMNAAWRNMFILRESGDKALDVVDLPAVDVARWKDEAALFTLAHIHAAWQMTLEGQRRVLTSLEPALALELLLLNIAMLPRLLPLDGLARATRPAGNDGAPPSSAPSSTSGAPSGTPGQGPASGGHMASASADAGAEAAIRAAQNAARIALDKRAQQPAPSPMQEEAGQAFSTSPEEAFGDMAAHDPVHDSGPEVIPSEQILFGDSYDAEGRDGAAPGQTVAPETPSAPRPVRAARPARTTPPEDRSWTAFIQYCKQYDDISPAFAGMIRSLSGEWNNGVLELIPASEFCANRLALPETREVFMDMIHEYFGEGTSIAVLPPPAVKSPAEIKEEVRAHPAVQLLEKEMGARLIDYGLPQGNTPVQ